MELEFTDLLVKANFHPGDVRLMRHQQRAPNGRTPYVLWRDNRAAFENFQQMQTSSNRPKLAAPFWASFVVPPGGGTLFAGIYSTEWVGAADVAWIDPLYDRPGSELTTDQLERYNLSRADELANYIGRLWVEWGAGARSWVQRADRQNKAIVKLTHEFHEETFPGYTRFIANISEITTLPPSWITALRAVRGIYLLSSAKTREQYVGSASSDGGFYARWLNYATDGHGGNLGLKSSEPSDYQVSILEVSGSLMSTNEIISGEQLWKRKLQSREMGLNRN